MGENVPQEDLDWAMAYEKSKTRNRAASKTHKVSFTEESAEAAGEGAEGVAAAMAAPLLAKEEGRRLDNLILAGNQTVAMANAQTNKAFEMLLRMSQQVLERNSRLEEIGIKMLETVREGHIARTQAEAALIMKDAEREADEMTRGEESGGVDKMIGDAMPVIIEAVMKRLGPGVGKAKG
jgi:hypothetical protein